MDSASEVSFMYIKGQDTAAEMRRVILNENQMPPQEIKTSVTFMYRMVDHSQFDQ